MTKTLKFKLLFIVMFLSPINGYSQGVVVIPMFDDPEPIKNVIVVAKSGGDFTDPISAVESISDNEEENRYVIYIAPGTYILDKALEMKSFVSLVGSGRDLTKIQGSFSSSGPGGSGVLIHGADTANITNLNLSNIRDVASPAGGGNAVGIYNEDVKMRIIDVSILVTAGLNNYGILNDDASPFIREVHLEAGDNLSSGSNYGIYNQNGSRPVIEDSFIDANYGKNNYGIYNAGFSSTNLNTVKVRAGVGTADHVGYYVENGLPEIINSWIEADGVRSGTDPFFIAIRGAGDDGQIFVRRTTILGADRAIQVDAGSSATIGQSTVAGDVSGAGSIKCVANDTYFGDPLGTDCQPLP